MAEPADELSNVLVVEGESSFVNVELNIENDITINNSSCCDDVSDNAQQELAITQGMCSDLTFR